MTKVKCTFEKCLFIKDGKNRPQGCPLIEIIRCGECKWLGVDDGMPFCYWWLREIEPNVFCSYGERRADETDTKESKDM